MVLPGERRDRAGRRARGRRLAPACRAPRPAPRGPGRRRRGEPPPGTGGGARRHGSKARGSGVSAPPRVSVLVAAFNGEAFIGDALASLAAQTASDFEAIVV